MDYARKIGKKKEPHVWRKTSITMVTAFDYNLIKDVPKDIEDRRLRNWKKWLAEREKISRRIKSITGRPKINQIINSSEKVRSLIELKNLMEYASIPVPVIPDKYRGGPEFWKVPESLAKHGDDICLPEITMVPTKRDLNLPPDLTYVDVPELIEEEKGLRGISLNERTWERNLYFKRREKELHEEIKLLMPKKPETKELLIRGKTFVEPKREPIIPVITITAPEEEKSDDLDLAIILKIQDREIVQNSNDQWSDEKPIEWDLIFRGRIDERSEQKIIFENKGNIVIHYRWRDSSFQSNFQFFRKHDSPFHFNKNDGIVLQGTIEELKIWYLPRSSNVFTESWRLFTDPKICNSPLIFRFWGCAEERDYKRSNCFAISKIDLYLYRCIKDSIIREIIETIMANIDYRKPSEPAYSSLFLESDVFRAKNPYHFYHTNIILELRKLYHEVTDRPAVPWNLSLNDLREILLLIKRSERRQQMLLRFNNLYKECLKPPLISTFVNDKKYTAVYNALCSFANCFEIESEFILANCILIKENKPSNSNVSSLLRLPLSNINEDREKKQSNKFMNPQTFESNVSLAQSHIAGQLYKEIFFVRIYEILSEIIDRISAIINSYNRLDGVDTSFYLSR
ncbi:MYCBP-associated protein-like [Vespa velutina]|uniref:MYCBP-associated protein-like n=1 Tax=Vespa velutina TaxID=202808 RepID=UPI001FB1AB07|nr:MYCBP-associated protein-like [Vespa velutina]